MSGKCAPQHHMNTLDDLKKQNCAKEKVYLF